MTQPTLTPIERYAENLLEDSSARVRFQHDYTLAGFRTLFLIGGGAIVALLTYAGHAQDPHVARQFGAAFVWYVIGLVSTVLGYLAAYISQGWLANDCAMRAMQALGLEPESKRSSDWYRTAGAVCVYVGITTAVIALGAFIIGSLCALRALS
jgi:hypothetical protein